MKLSKYSKPKVLLTTSAYVEQLANDQTVYPADAFMQCVEYNRWLQQEITIEDFKGKSCVFEGLEHHEGANKWICYFNSRVQIGFSLETSLISVLIREKQPSSNDYLHKTIVTFHDLAEFTSKQLIKLKQ